VPFCHEPDIGWQNRVVSCPRPSTLAIYTLK
jgi:hypothetical protein